MGERLKIRILQAQSFHSSDVDRDLEEKRILTCGSSLNSQNSKPMNSTNLRVASRKIVSLPRRYGIRPGSGFPFFFPSRECDTPESRSHAHPIPARKRPLETRRFRAIRSRPRIRGIILKYLGLS